MATNLADLAAPPAAPQGAEVSKPAEPASSPEAQQGSGAPSPGAPPQESQNIRQIREAYEALKNQYEPYKKLGEFDEVNGRLSTHQQIMTAAMETALDLGFSEQEVREAMQADPWGTLSFIQAKAAEAKAKGQINPSDINRQIDRRVSERLKPFEEKAQAEKAEQAGRRFDAEAETQIGSVFKGEDLSDWEKQAAYTLAFDMFYEDKEAMQRLMNEGKTSDVAKYVTQAKEFMDRIYAERSGREAKRTGAKGPGQTPSKGEKRTWTLDDMARGDFPDGMSVSRQ